MAKGYPLSMMVSAMDAQTIDLARKAILNLALRDPALRRGWFAAKKELDSDAEEAFQRYQEMADDPTGRSLLDEVLDKEVAMGCPASVHSWNDEFNPNDDLPF